MFGLNDKDEFIDHKNIKLKQTLIKRLKNQENKLHPNYWRMKLLNGNSSVLEDNYM
jgi:hypothetical protein